jgi:hypothetical protein
MGRITDYEKDFYGWALHNAELLRQGRLSEIDIEHIAEELESTGKRDRRELTSRFKILLAHLLKWQYQPKYRGRSWQRSVDEQRSEIIDLITDNPHLKNYISQSLIDAYPKAVKLAVKETRLSTNSFPLECPYSLENILAENFYPENE